MLSFDNDVCFLHHQKSVVASDEEDLESLAVAGLPSLA